LTEERRRNIVLDFIIQNQECNIESVVKGVNNHVGRVKVYKILDNLEEEEKVRKTKKKANARDVKLSVDIKNPLVVVPRELKEFGNNFLQFYKASIEKFSHIDKIKRNSLHYNIILYPLHMFSDVNNFYNIHSLFLWPKQIRDESLLKNLYWDVFTEISAIQFKMLQMKNSLQPRNRESNDILLKSMFLDRVLEVDKWTNYTSKMMKYYDAFVKFGMKEQIEPVLDFIWNLSSPYREYIYGDYRMKEWNYNYQNGWKKLLELKNLHPLES
jgi:hypothetical protein